MKVVTKEGGRILDRLSTEELRPAKGIFLPDFIAAINARYKFTSYPTNLMEAAKGGGAKFEYGKFDMDDGPAVIKELSLYSDGLICEAYDTPMADLVLDDFIEWATAEFNMQPRQNPVMRTYSNSLVCIFEKEVESALDKISQMNKLFSKSLKDAYGWDYKVDLARIACQVDPTNIPHLRNTNFVIERRVQSPFSENRFFCLAPLKTDAHIKLLETIERELLAN
jgi:hypothetical protein